MSVQLVTLGDDGVTDEIRSLPSPQRQDLLREQLLLHFAFRGNELDAFRDLVEEAVKEKHDLDRFLNVKDHHGNTVLHIAVANNLIAVVEQLLAEAVDVNCKNKKGETALDMCRALPNSEQMGRILTDAGGGHISVGIDDDVGEPLLPATKKSLAHSSMETKGALLTMLGVFAAVSLSAASNPPAMIMRAQQMVAAPMAFRFSDIVTGCVPAPFYFLVGNTAVFTVSMGAIAVVLWFLPCMLLTLFLVLMVFMGYILCVGAAMPRFVVKIGSWNVSSPVLVWILALALICCGVIFVAVVKYVCSYVYQYCAWLKGQ